MRGSKGERQRYCETDAKEHLDHVQHQVQHKRPFGIALDYDDPGTGPRGKRQKWSSCLPWDKVNYIQS